MTQFVSSPSLDGASAQFSVFGNTPYASALWWKQLTPQPAATHFVYDLQFYLTQPEAAQALEFDINQSVNGRKYIFGTQCDIVGTAQWDVWDTANHHWIASGVPCTAPKANIWHHLTIEAERVGSQTHFIAITLDGNAHAIDLYFESKPVDASELNVAVQLDENSRAENYSMWVDQISLSYQ
jgi:hypothetical protein